MRQALYMFAVMLLAANLLTSTGCVKPPPSKGGDKGQSAKKPAAHDHPDAGPHGGALAEWGDEKYHAEFTVDHGKKQATVYILDGDAKKAAPIAATTIDLAITNVKPLVRVALKADPQKDDPKGQASRFVGTADELGKEMEFKGEISGNVAGTPYTGSFEEKEHSHGHDKKK
jgi:hypothetical protein